jgi:four helix bundle protein
MSDFVYARSFRELRVYAKSRALSQRIFEFTKQLPKDETYSLTDQIRRSSRSIGANIAEAWAKKSYEKHFLSKLTDADGEQQETQHWVEVARDCDYWTNQIADELLTECALIGRMLGVMMQKSDMFCSNPPRTARDEVAEYFITDTSATVY